MTLTKSPCDLDTMSLFQDLKLKRRKVDSRCSSDGESVADTSASSPDMAGPGSPCKLETARSSPSPGTHRDRVASPDSALPEGDERVAVESQEQSCEDTAENKAKVNEELNVRVFDGGGMLARRESSAMSSPPSFWLSGARVNGDVPETGGNYSETMKPPAASPQRAPSGGSRSVIVGESVNSDERTETASECAGEDKDVVRQEAAIVSSSQPTFWVTTGTTSICRINGELQEFLGGNFTDSSKPPVSSPQRTGGSRSSSTVIVGDSLTGDEERHCEEESKVKVKEEVNAAVFDEGRRDPAAAFWVTAGTPPVVSGCRINGVMPELIGGGVNYGETMKPPVSSPQSSGAVRPAPTVIMGEAGGVRTMIWSQPSVEPTPTVAGTSSSNSCWSSSSVSSPSSASNSEESAAQLLLNLGQERAFRSQQFPVPLNMERLWAGDLSQLPSQALNLTAAGPAPWAAPSAWLKNGELPAKMGQQEEAEDEDQPMICMICEDKATGLHYGIITCEGCKGFFKRTVQNRRVYTCVADGVCEITKAQRNRCQYCRFKKCIEQGMVLQAVREDRMPGGRNSGAVYNLYKVKYKKHKKNARNGQVKPPQTKLPVSSEHGIPPHLVNGTILKTALTNPKEVVHLRQRLDNAVSSSRDLTLTLDTALAMIQILIDCDDFQDIATVQNLEDLLEHKTDLSDRLMQIGDSIVYKLVQWTKKLPFYLELPVEVHTKLLTHKWHELLVLTTSAYQAIHGPHKPTTPSDSSFVDFTQEVSKNLSMLQTCLTSMMGRTITLEQLRQDVGHMVEKITHVTLIFRRIKLRIEEYVLLKVIIMLNPATRGGANELEAIQERYMNCLKTYVEYTAPNQPSRFHELLLCLPEVQTAASLLLESKMFYVPFLLNSAIQR
ncbi:hormone receptor 4-like isoform X2 [Homalodisca vitripennis]|uniref:hormone receptor 4-like isoform X2 n=1 Tax=Homalodisca vitripennis TaxID=197043 RepID=UPI001EEC9DD1|nr:hormone receptor 4-like isoform X2 [Homalodisca vitripennis]